MGKTVRSLPNWTFNRNFASHSQQGSSQSNLFLPRATEFCPRSKGPPRAQQVSAGRSLPHHGSLLAAPRALLAEDTLPVGQGSHFFCPRWEKG